MVWIMLCVCVYVNCFLSNLKGVDLNFSGLLEIRLSARTYTNQSVDRCGRTLPKANGGWAQWFQPLNYRTSLTKTILSYETAKPFSGPSFSRDLSWVLHLSVYTLSSQQAFNATAVIRHMRRLQLGTSFGSSIHNANSVSNPQSRAPAKSQSVDCAPLSLTDCEWHTQTLSADVNMSNSSHHSQLSFVHSSTISI